MGCGGSKVDDLPLVVRCRERRELIRAAADHRYTLAYAHLAYFGSLPAVGDALRRFVDEELIVAASSPSASPVLTLPSREGKKKKNNGKTSNSQTRNDLAISSSSTSLSHSGSGSHIHLSDHDGDDGSHLHLPSDSDSELNSSGHIHLHDSPDNTEMERHSHSSPPPIQTDWGPYGVNQPAEANWDPYGYVVYPPHQPGWDTAYGMNSTSYTYYMQRSSPQVRSVIYDPSKSVAAAETSYSYSSYQYDSGSGGFFGFPMRSPAPPQNQQPSSPAVPPSPPSPKVSAWDFLNPFDGYDLGYPGYYSYGRYGYGSMASSPDSNEVREREGIPDLEDETESEAYGEVHKGKNSSKLEMKGNGNLGEGTSKSKKLQSHGIGSSEGSSVTVPSHGSSEGSSRGIPSEIGGNTSREEPSQNGEATHSVKVKVEKSSPDSGVSKGTEDGSLRRKGVTFEMDVGSGHDAESSKLSSLTTLSADSTRDLQEVVAEIRDEFATASSYGKEVAMLLEVGKLPYQPRFNLLKVILSRVLYMVAPSSSSSRSSSRKSVRFAFNSMKLAKSYFRDSGRNPSMKPSDLSSTLEKLYVWEKKLYKEVKDEERLRIIYEKQCKRLKILDDQGAESSKIDATQASIRKLLAKLDVCIKAVGAISNRIHKLRDEELQPQVTELIYGLIRMWKTMLKCHQKQFQAIMASKTWSSIANTSHQRDSSLRATVELEMQLLTWCNRFSDWIKTQKSFIESLNGWLLRCLIYEAEETPDGIIPFSPGRIGAPPIFVICHDWFQAMETITETGVVNAMRNFASGLHQLWEKQDEEKKQRLKAEYLSRDFERQLRALRMDKGRMKHDQDTVSDKTGVSLVPSESGVSARDDLKVDLDSMRKRLEEEWGRHKEAAKLVNNVASSSLHAGLVPIFEALGNFTSNAVKAYEHVRIQDPGPKTEPKETIGGEGGR